MYIGFWGGPIKGHATNLVQAHMSYTLNSFNGVMKGIIYGTTVGVIEGDTRSLDYSSLKNFRL